jgi:Xaa-Pro aminopeptidase
MGTSYGSIVTVRGEVLHNEEHGNELGPRDLLLADVGAETPGGWAGDVTRTWPVSGRYSPAQAALYDVVLRAQKATIAAVRPGVRYRDLHLLAARHLAEGLVDLGVLRGDPGELVADGVVYLLFPHGIGHLLGLDVHDMEDLGDRAGYAPARTRAPQFGLRALRLDRDLVAGMAVTIEPGLYVVPAILDDPELARLAGDRLDRARLATFSDVRGIRIEDDVLVTPEGCEVLTAAIPKERTDVERVMA